MSLKDICFGIDNLAGIQWEESTCFHCKGKGKTFCLKTNTFVKPMILGGILMIIGLTGSTISDVGSLGYYLGYLIAFILPAWLLVLAISEYYHNKIGVK